MAVAGRGDLNLCLEHLWRGPRTFSACVPFLGQLGRDLAGDVLRSADDGPGGRSVILFS